MANVKKDDLQSMRASARYCRRKAGEVSDKALRLALFDLADAYDELTIAEGEGIVVSLTPATIH